MSSKEPKVVLSIAGYDPSSGAGVTADIKTAAAHDCFGISCITALTVQSTAGVRAVEPTHPVTVRRTLQALAEDFNIAAVRIGMLGSGAVAAEVVDFLRARSLRNIVLDPVLKASSGALLLDNSGFEILRDVLMPMVTVITPNTVEAEALTGIQISDEASQRTAASLLLRLGARAVVITGGHLTEARDLLCWKDETGLEQEEIYTDSVLKSSSTHGTGCAFATSLACSLAIGKSLVEAAGDAKTFVRCAIDSAPAIGHGRGPLDLLWPLERA